MRGVARGAPVPTGQHSRFARVLLALLASQAVAAGRARSPDVGRHRGSRCPGEDRGGRRRGAMLRWLLRGFVLPPAACQSDYDRLAYEILFEDLDRNGDGVVDILELRDGLYNWNSSFGSNSEKVSHRERMRHWECWKYCCPTEWGQPEALPLSGLSRAFLSLWRRSGVPFCGGFFMRNNTAPVKHVVNILKIVIICSDKTSRDFGRRF